MIDQSAQLHELPNYWQDKIRQYRRENHNLRARLRDTERLSGQELTPSWAKKLRKLRDENVQLRRERNAFRDELEARGECDECHCQVRSDAAVIARGECPRSGAPVGKYCHQNNGACLQCPLNCNR
ncbi:hypothetical protein [Mycolicibacterium vaccae]|uniref:hypothetical protein n=1 Tax=Mycolicibacterium vaccae TaxID=1810 RepID=UPI003D0413E1